MPNPAINQSTVTETREFSNRLQRNEIFTPKYESQKSGENDNKSSLSIAIDKLSNAVDEQCITTQRFKSSTAELKSVILTMQKNVIKYKAQLAQINVAPLRRKSLRLARIMGQAK